MAIGGICQSCGKYSPGLYTCKSCRSRCCPVCVDNTTGFCKICKGRKK